MHSGKIQPGKIDEGIVGSKDDLWGSDCAPGSDHPIPFHLFHRRVLVDGQPAAQGLYKFQRVELGLSRKAHRSCMGNRQRNLLHQLRCNVQLFGCLLLGLEFFQILRIHIGSGLLKIAGNPLLKNDPSIFLQSPLVGLKILLRLFLSLGLQQGIAKHPVLGGDLCGGVLGLAAGDPPRLQNHSLLSCLLQLPGDQKPRHPASDDSHISADVFSQLRPPFNLAGLSPNRFHSCLPNGFTYNISWRRLFIPL